MKGRRGIRRKGRKERECEELGMEEIDGNDKHNTTQKCTSQHN
jgi:hypothetical protein